jgi:DNA-directed RNA polymerase I, II, and III subunit RPABC2
MPKIIDEDDDYASSSSSSGSSGSSGSSSGSSNSSVNSNENDDFDDDDYDDEEFEDENEEGGIVNNKKKRENKKDNSASKDDEQYDEEYEDVVSDTDDNVLEEDDEPIENYLQKINETLKSDIITNYHPQLKPHNYEEIQLLTKIQRNKYGDIIDDLHKTTPIMTKYERTRILSERTVQINLGMQSFLEDNAKDVIDGYLIALEELKQKKIPFIVKRPMPNGAFEYWNASDLEII